MEFHFVHVKIYLEQKMALAAYTADNIQHLTANQLEMARMMVLVLKKISFRCLISDSLVVLLQIWRVPSRMHVSTLVIVLW